MHGGAPGSGAPRGNRNALKQGLYTQEAFAERRQVSELLRQSRELIAKHAAIVACAAENRGRHAMEEPFEKDPVPSTLNHNRPCTMSQGVSFSSIKCKNRTDLTFELNGEEQTSRFMAAFGSQDPDFVFELLRQVANTTPNSRFADEQGIKFMMSVVTGLKPRDQTEAMIGAQMAAVHSAMMTAANRLAHAETLAEMDSAERAVNKLGRTFAALVETVNRYRNGGEHNVMVQHLSIAEAGPAIVGHLTRSARKSKPQKPAKKMAALIDGRQTTVEIIEEPTRVKVPLRRPAPAVRRHISGAAVAGSQPSED
jgi:hypothetical protein